MTTANASRAINCSSEALKPVFPFNSQTCTDYGEDISPLIMLFDGEEKICPAQTQTSSNNDAPSSNSLSAQSLGKRRFSNDSSFTSDPRELKKARTDVKRYNNDPSQPYLIAHLPEYEKQMMELSLGVLWEMARLISAKKITYEDISTERLAALRGTNAKAGPETVRVFRPDVGSDAIQDPAFAQEIAVKSPWEELDKEEDALKRDPYAGLGNSEAPWYGGKVIFKGKLSADNGPYEISLERCVLGPSCRFTRRFGSSSFMRIKIPAKVLHKRNNELNDFFRKPFVLWGNIFRAFYAKDDTVFLFRTDELLESNHILPGHLSRMSLLEFIEWHNPLQTNQNQAMTKWAARTALGLSTSFPGPVLPPENIIEVEDKICEETKSDMTDGCGYSNRAMHRRICRILQLDQIPAGFQFRLGGVKGMSCEAEPDDNLFDEAERIWIRPSQIKIRYPLEHRDQLDPAFRTVELLRTSYMRTPGRISAETIINLAENGVPASVFVNMLKSQVREVVQGLTTWDGPDAMYKLWANVERAGAVLFSKRAREAAGEARIRGFGDRTTEEDDQDEDDDDGAVFDKDLAERSIAWWADQTSGCPSSLEETVMVLLDSGFTPQNSHVLRDKLKQVVVSKIKSTTQTFRYNVLQSATAFVIPDPYGVLEVDQIQIKSSKRNLPAPDREFTDTIKGDVLMMRNPCKLPTDARKVQAVEHPKLRELVDVIVCSVKGLRRLIDFLAGGDYDGDRATVYWGLEMVLPFRNADERHSIEPLGVAGCFSSTDGNEKVLEFINRTGAWPPSEKTPIIQTYLLGALRDASIVGKYSTMHDNAVYSLGYANPRTIRLAYIFCKVLDGAKTGLKIKPSTLRSDEKKYNTTLGPAWKAKPKKREEINKANHTWLKRGERNEFIPGQFIMDTLCLASNQECDKALRDMKIVFEPLPLDFVDSHLAQPWDDAKRMAELGPPELVRCKKRDLSKIAVHVHKMIDEHRSAINMVDNQAKGKKFTEKPIEVRQDILRSLSKKFAASPCLADMETIMDEATISRLRASYAYIYDGERRRATVGWSRFPWDVALRELCHIKASALGPYKTVTSGFYDRFKMSKQPL